MTMLRGYADDLPLHTWLNEHIFPAEARMVTPENVAVAARFAFIEMIKSGTTCFNDMYFFHGAVARAGLQAGLRTFVGCTILEFPTNYAACADEYLQKALAERQDYQGEERVTFTLAPHAPYTVSDDTFRKIVTTAEQADMLVHCHIHETAGEVADSLRDHGVRPLARLAGLGLLSHIATDSQLRALSFWMLGSLAHFRDEDRVAFDDMPELERLMLHRLWEVWLTVWPRTLVTTLLYVPR